jgi:hypothetical protein
VIRTIADAETAFGLTHLEHLDRGADIPVITRSACQGDVSVRRVMPVAPAGAPVLPAGAAVLRGDHAHVIFAVPGEGKDPAAYAPAGPGDGLLALGVLTVPEGSQALLDHPEHGDLLIAPGTYVIGRQREFAGQWRAVAD